MTSTTAGRPRLRPDSALLPWGVAAVAVLVYLNSLANGFALDDAWIVPRNANVTDLANFFRLWARPYWPGDAGQALGLYRPLPIALYSLQWALAGDSPWLFHAVNVLLHAGVSVLVFALARRLVPPFAAAAGALLFAVHAVHTEAVANVVGQAEMLAALFVLLACLVATDDGTGRGGWRRIGLVAFCYVAAIASKENALVLPALLAFVLPAARLTRSGDRASWAGVVREWLGEWRLFVVLALVAIAFLVVRWRILGSALSVEAPWLPFAGDPPTRVRTALRLWNEYARLLFFPADLSFDYSVAVILPATEIGPAVVTGSLVLVAVVAMAASLPRRPIVGLCGGWFLVSILPTSNLFVLAGVVLAERTLYLPSVALALGAAAVVQAVRRRVAGDEAVKPAARLLVGAGVLALLALAARTWIRNPDWASTQSINASLLRDHPESYKAQWYAAGLDFERGLTAAAGERFVLALRMEPGSPQLRADYGEFLLRTGAADSAVAVLEPAVGLPFHPRAIDELLALAYLRSGRCRDAVDAARLAQERFGVSWQAQLVTVEALLALRATPEAADAAAVMAEIDGPAAAYRSLIAAHAFHAAGRAEDAARARAEAATAEPATLEAAELTARATLRRVAESSCRSP